MSADLARHWSLEPSIDYLNHGAFGACPIPVLRAQTELRTRMEREPVQFLTGELEPLLDAALGELAGFVGADPEDVAFVPNATTGVNSVLRSLRFQPGDQLLTTDHAYNACRNALDWVAQRWGAEVVAAPVPFPITSPDEVLESVLGAVTDHTVLAVLDHISSPTALIFPIDSLVASLEARGVDTLVDGAHAPGMVPLALERLGAAYYTGNCHKWLCAPKGAGFLHVRRDRQHLIVPTVVSHGVNSPRTDKSRFRLLFDWTGTHDPTPYLCLPDALRFMGGLLPGGWEEVMTTNRSLARVGREIVCTSLGIPSPSPDDMVGSIAAIPLARLEGPGPASPLDPDPLQRELFRNHHLEVPVFYWSNLRIARISAQLYNRPEQYRRLASALATVDASPAYPAT